MSLRELSNASPWRAQAAAPFPALPLENKAAIRAGAEESDEEELFTVPDLEAKAEAEAPPTSSKEATSSIQVHHSGTVICSAGGPPKLRRGRNPQDRDYRRLKRLLRNRVSAQQARERKKVYVNDLESRARELQDANTNLEEKISILIKENTMLRKVLMNMRPKVDESTEGQSDNRTQT